MNSDHLDYLPLIPGGPVGFYRATRPPCNATVVGIIGAVAALASTYISYDAAQTAAKQSEMNAQAQADAIGEERKRQALEEDENRRRAVVEQRRFRAQQLAAMSGNGAMLGTGTSLAIEADTWAKQQTELADQQRMAELSQRSLAFQQANTLAMGGQQAAALRREGTGAAISGLASAAGGSYQAFSTRPQPAAPTYRNGYVQAVPA
jgi:hypothetical protein